MKNVKRDITHLNLLCDIGELTNLLSTSSDTETFLQRTAELVAGHLNADVCSIYLYEEKANLLVLKATKGLNPSAVNHVKMRPGEGLVGYSFDESKIICESNARKSPHFKYFEEAGEDPFTSFLAVPIYRGNGKIGVIVVEHETEDHFNAFDIRALRATASQLAAAVENARLLMELQQQTECVDAVPEKRLLQFVKGDAVYSGYALGTSAQFKKQKADIFNGVKTSAKKYTIDDFKSAVDCTAQQLRALEADYARRLPESVSLIFAAHFMILKDKQFSGSMVELIETGEAPVEAVKKVARRYVRKFSDSPYSYIREKALDVEDLAQRILENFEPAKAGREAVRKRILIASRLYPSDMLRLVSSEVLGIIFVGGGLVSHVAILARSLNIPFVVTDEIGLLEVPDNTPVLLDAEQGNIYIHPSDETIALFETKKDAEKESENQHYKLVEQTQTADGVKVQLLANINVLSEISLAKKMKAEGVGLYRTEFPFLIRKSVPSEAEQYVIYKKLFDSMPEKSMTIRTLDVGGEKMPEYWELPKEDNPELGLRSVRLSLRYQAIFKCQIRAILRAAATHNRFRLMFPLVSSVDEFLEIKKIVMACMDDLATQDMPYHTRPMIGLMIELPSAVSIIDAYAKHADFFSVGTNDFIQYMLAADRSNKSVADYYLPHHPAVLRGLARIANAATSAGIDVTVCGEMAHDPHYVPFLIGIGVRTLSIDPQFIPQVQACIASLTAMGSEHHAQQLLAESTIRGAYDVIRNYKHS